MKPGTIIAAAALTLAGLAFAALRPANVPEPVPTVAYTLLDGTTADTRQWRGKVVFVNFWATTCAVCVKEMPQVVATHQRFAARGFETLAVAMAYDPPVSVMHFAQSRQLPFRVAMDHGGTIAKAFGDVQATPTAVLINRRGEIIERYVGEPDRAALNALVERLLAES